MRTFFDPARPADDLADGLACVWTVLACLALGVFWWLADGVRVEAPDLTQPPPYSGYPEPRTRP